MMWNEVDGSWWTIPGSRTKNRHDHRVYLTATAIELLKAVPKVEDEPHVFIGYRGKRQLAAINTKVFADVRRRRNPRHAMRDTVEVNLLTVQSPSASPWPAAKAMGLDPPTS